ncbi:hypothetical protein SGPA1_50838 [Streptomyces misionensis JCM 4497]
MLHGRVEIVLVVTAATAVTSNAYDQPGKGQAHPAALDAPPPPQTARPALSPAQEARPNGRQSALRVENMEGWYLSKG